jgi:enoyl-CoA hydratase/carnithine racemase
MSTERILYAVEDGIATITLNRPEKLNCLDPNMLAAIDGHLQAIDVDPDIRVLIVTATGERAFCVGADITVWSGLEPIEMWRRWVRVGSGVFDRLARLRVPTIAALNGFTFGGGLELALACDLRIAVEHAEFSAPEVKIATVPGWGGTRRLAETIGTARAKQMIFTGERIMSETAESWGLINERCSAEKFQDRVSAIAQSIAENAPISVQLAKAAIDGATGADPTIALEAMAGALAASTADGREGVQAFREKRPPRFSGS